MPLKFNPPWSGKPPIEIETEGRSDPKPGYYKGNPPSPITVNGQEFYIHMTFTKRSEADEEARDLRDSGYRTHIEPWMGGYALYETSRS